MQFFSGRNQYSVSDQVIRGGVKIQKRDLETKDTKAQGSATLKDTAFAIISLNENSVLVEGKLYKKTRQLRRFRQGLTELQQRRQIYFRMVNTNWKKPKHRKVI